MIGAFYQRAYPLTAHRSWLTFPDGRLLNIGSGYPYPKDLFVTLFKHPRIRYDRIIFPAVASAAGNYTAKIALYDPKDGSRIIYEEKTFSTGAVGYPHCVMLEVLVAPVRERRPGWLVLAFKWTSDNELTKKLTFVGPSNSNQAGDLFEEIWIDGTQMDWSDVSLKKTQDAGGEHGLNGFAGKRNDADMVMPTTLPPWTAFVTTTGFRMLALLIDGASWEADVDGLV